MFSVIQPIYISTENVRVPFSLYHGKYLLTFFFLLIAILPGVRQVNVVLIFASMMISDLKYFFQIYFTVELSSLYILNINLLSDVVFKYFSSILLRLSSISCFSPVVQNFLNFMCIILFIYFCFCCLSFSDFYKKLLVQYPV